MRDGLRRALHASTAGLALLGLTSLGALRAVAVCLAVASVVVEFLRLRIPAVGRSLATRVPVYRDRERTRPSGAMWLALGYAIVVWLPPPAGVAGLLVGALADPAGALVGSRFGRGARKSLPGSAAVAFTAAGAVLVVGLPLGTALLAGIAAAAAERWSGPLDDNLLVAPAAGLVIALVA
jgi:dolichol kinase